MAIDTKQLRDLIIRPTLESMRMYSASAENLLLGTCAQESHMGTYIKQLGKGPALGIFQMEPQTYYDIHKNYLSYKTNLIVDLANLSLLRRDPMTDQILPYSHDKLISDMGLATAFARLAYYRQDEPLPEHDNIDGLFYYYKKYYNSYIGKATLEEWRQNYDKHVTRALR